MKEQNSRELDMVRHILIGMMVCFIAFFGISRVYAADITPGRWWQEPGLAAELKLTEKEKLALDDLFNKDRNRLIDLRGYMEKERIRLDDILSKEKLDESAARDQFKRMENIRYKISSERFSYILGVRKILGADRFHLLEGKFEEMRNKRFGRGEPGFRGND